MHLAMRPIPCTIGQVHLLVLDMVESSDEYVGSFLSEKGISSAMLLSCDSVELTSVEVSNGVILADLYYFLCKYP